MTNVVPARNRLVGSALRQYREAAGYSLADAAGLLKCSLSKISRIESGKRGIRLWELRDLLAGYGADGDAGDALAAIAGPRRAGGWLAGYRSLFTGDHLDFLAAESAAAAIFTYAPVQLPALLQGTAYARAAAAADPGVPPDAAETVVRAVYARQWAVLREQDTPVTVVIGEGALCQRAGDVAMMRAQYRRLVTLAAAAPKVTLHILPFTAGLPAAGGAGGFSVLQFGRAPAPGLVHLAGPDGGTCLDAPETVAAYLRAFACLRRSALTVGDSASWLGQMPGG